MCLCSKPWGQPQLVCLLSYRTFVLFFMLHRVTPPNSSAADTLNVLLRPFVYPDLSNITFDYQNHHSQRNADRVTLGQRTSGCHFIWVFFFSKTQGLKKKTMNIMKLMIRCQQKVYRGDSLLQIPCISFETASRQPLRITRDLICAVILISWASSTGYSCVLAPLQQAQRSNTSSFALRMSENDVQIKTQMLVFFSWGST